MTDAMMVLAGAGILVVLLVMYYRRTAALAPALVYQDNPHNKALLQKLPRLSRRFYVTPWLFNTHLQLLALGLKKGLGKKLAYEQTDVLTMADGGTTALHWLGLDKPADSPTLLVLHTITGSPHSMRGLVRDLADYTGFRVVLCQRRGHGDLPLTAPRINTMGDTADLREQIGVIQARYPQSDLYAIGSSAGSGLLVRFLGEEGAQSPIKAGMAYCPGYNIEVAFARAKPFYSRMMAKKLIRQFITSHVPEFSGFRTYQQCIQSQDLHEFHQNLYECAGFSTLQDFMDASNPMKVFQNIQVPLLILNAEDDPVCHIDNAWEYQQQVKQMPNTLLAITRRGSHCAYFSGLTLSPWGHQLAAEFFVAQHQTC
ncbi:YheT family hydrolase [Thalassolituus sp. LLYu03]|uniref:YheT family hydrolase n=1 Tax=Thalassolituus sp. LLYu03 TaxID=3421656 RepID=UPI003D296520